MVELPLSKNLTTIIDDEDFELIGKFKWYAKVFGPDVYAARNDYSEGTRSPKTLLLHRVLLNAKKGEYVDHISRDTLDNRRSNLRLCNNMQNTWNRKMHKNNKVGFKGVTRNLNKTKPWTARIDANGPHHLGVFKTKEEAANAYNEAAIKYHGKFARLNIINNKEK